MHSNVTNALNCARNDSVMNSEVIMEFSTGLKQDSEKYFRNSDTTKFNLI